MATLATLVDWITTATGVREAAGERELIRGNEDFRLRALPNEEIYFFVREVDNSRVIPLADQRATRVCWKVIGASCLAVLLLIGVLAPLGYNLLAGYQINALEKEQQVLLRERTVLELKEAQLVSPKRLAELGRMQLLVDPAPETVVALAPAANDGNYLALNQSQSQ